MNQEVILVINSNHQSADLTAGSILPSLGYSALVAYDSIAALELIRKHHQQISLLLVAMEMTEMDGLELLHQISKGGYEIPAILVTAQGTEQITVDAFRLGVQDYIKEPVEMDELRDTIPRVLSKSHQVDQRENLSAQLREQVSWLTALSNVGRSVTSTLDLNTVLRRIVEAGVYLTRADQGFIALSDPESDRLFLRAVKNVDEQDIDTLRIPVKDSLVGKAIDTGRPVRRTRDAREQGLKVSTGFLVHSLIHAPIIYQGRALGVLSVNNHIQSHNFTEKDEAILTSLADYAAIAIENANSFEQAQQEIAERKRIAAALRESEERYALAVNGANDGIWDWDLKTNTIYYSPRWKAMLGYENDEINNSPDEWFSRIDEDDLEHTRLEISAHIRRRTSHFINEHRLLHKDGAYRWMLSRGMAVWDDNGNAVRIAGSLSDITDRKKAEEQLLHDAFHDSLSGLPNKALFVDRLSQALLRLRRNVDYRFAVLFMDLDRFKDINDSFGHLVGDHFLNVIAQLLQKGVRTGDTLARFGGDEFIILLDDIKDDQGVMRVADWIRDQFLKPIKVDGHEVFTSTSIGIVYSSPEYNGHEEIIRDADIAMYFAKSLGGGRAKIFEAPMRDRVLDRLTLETDLRKAINNEELCVHYQPIADLESGKLIGFEALVRWQHPEKGLLPPDVFMDLAEETSMIISIDRWVLRHACRQIQKWNQMYSPDPALSVNVNISAKHIVSQELREFLIEVLAETGLEPDSLKLEITEFSLVDQSDITATAFTRLKELGVQIQIDDFGIGYSSLGYLSNFPINALKIDRSFVNDIIEDTGQRDIVEAIIALTKRLNVQVIAEGVETPEQLAKLRELGCRLGQGYFLSTPLDGPHAEQLITHIKFGTGMLPALEPKDY